MPPTGENCCCWWEGKSWCLSQQPLWIQEAQVFHRRISPTKHPWKVLEYSMCRWWMWGGVKVWGGDARGTGGVETPPSSMRRQRTEDLKGSAHRRSTQRQQPTFRSSQLPPWRVCRTDGRFYRTREDIIVRLHEGRKNTWNDLRYKLTRLCLSKLTTF